MGLVVCEQLESKGWRYGGTRQCVNARLDMSVQGCIIHELTLKCIMTPERTSRACRFRLALVNRDCLSLCTTYSGDLQKQRAVIAGQGRGFYHYSPGVLRHQGQGALIVAQRPFGRRQDVAREGHTKKLSHT